MNSYAILGTKGGNGKSTAALMVLPVLFSDMGKKIKIYHLDNHNQYKITSSYLTFVNLRMKDAGSVIDEVEMAAISNTDTINIIDAGGGNDSMELLDVIKKTQVKNLSYIIPLMDDIEQLYNLKNKIKAIKNVSNDAEIFIILNRVDAYDEDTVKGQFIGLFGSKKYAIDAYLEQIEDDIVSFVLLRSNPLFSVLKNIYGTTLLDAYHDANDLLENVHEKKIAWQKKGIDIFKKNNARVRMAHDVNTIVAEIQDQMKPLMIHKGAVK